MKPGRPVKPPGKDPKPPKTTGRLTLDPDATGMLLAELARSPEIKKIAEKLGISEKAARETLASIGERERPAVPEPRETLFADLDKTLLEPAPAKVPRAPKARAGAYDIYVDGASRGNPGRAGAGSLIVDSSGTPVKRLRKYLGVVTNNVAEYEALVMALSEAVRLGAKEVRVFADSELMVKQIKGQYKVKNAGLKPLYEKAMNMVDAFRSFRITHIYRDKNAEADRLANEAIDRA